MGVKTSNFLKKKKKKKKKKAVSLTSQGWGTLAARRERGQRIARGKGGCRRQSKSWQGGGRTLELKYIQSRTACLKGKGGKDKDSGLRRVTREFYEESKYQRRKEERNIKDGELGAG